MFITDDMVTAWFEDDLPSEVDIDQLIEEADIYAELIDMAIAYDTPIGKKLWNACKELLEKEAEQARIDEVEAWAE